MHPKKKVYFNSKQIAFATAPQRIKCMVAGRGFGKSSEIALIIYMWLRAMPRGKVFFASTTYEQIDNATLPPIREKLEEMGLRENVHYVVGKRPPAHWPQPYKPPKKYDRSIAFFNGFTIMLLSAERMNARRGGSYDAGVVDEAAFVKFAAFKSVFSASIRGNIGRFPKEVHRSLVILTSRPRNQDGKWVYLFRELAKRKPETVFYMEASAEDNRAALGDDWFQEQRDNMGDLEYIIEVLNQDVTVLPNGFYNKYKPHVHEYTPAYDVRGQMLDVDPDALLEASVDYGGWFNGMTVYQEDYATSTEYLKRVVWNKTDNIENLVDDFCEKFKHHRFKYVRLWGEPRMWDKTAKGKIAVTLVNRFQVHGWVCEVKTPPGYRTELQREQYQFMLKVLEEKDELLPRLRINRDACPEVITGITTADVRPDMTLDKSKEKDRDFPQEQATHLPQTVNYYFLQKHGDKIMQEHQANGRAGEVDFG